MTRSVQTFSFILLSALLLAAGDSSARAERVRWTHPDGGNVDFFRVHTGPSSGHYTGQVDVSSPAVGADGVFFVDLQIPDEDTVYVAMTAHSGGVASLLSNERVRAGTVADPGGSTSPDSPGAGDPPTGSASAAIDQFVLWDAESDTLIDGNFTNGATIDLGTYPCTAIEVVGNSYLAATGSPGSVRFTFDGDTSGGCSVPGFTHENQPPYVWEEELGSGQFSCAASLSTPGSHTLAVTPFDGDDCTGTAGPTATITFDVQSAGSAGTTQQLGRPGQPQIVID